MCCLRSNLAEVFTISWHWCKNKLPKILYLRDNFYGRYGGYKKNRKISFSRTRLDQFWWQKYFMILERRMLSKIMKLFCRPEVLRKLFNVTRIFFHRMSLRQAHNCYTKVFLTKSRHGHWRPLYLYLPSEYQTSRNAVQIFAKSQSSTNESNKIWFENISTF